MIHNDLTSKTLPTKADRLDSGSSQGHTMKNQNWRGIAEFVGITAIVGSLIFVGIQLRQDRIIALTQADQTNIASRIELNLAIAESAELWIKADSGEELSPTESLQLEKQIAALSADAMLSGNMRRSLGQAGNIPRQRLAATLFEHRSIRKKWLDLADRDIERFEKKNPNTQVYRSWRDDVQEELAKLDELDQ